ncbi:epoxide hydrolase [Cordyceps fumosorosea ARSEF 2679]|uniref:Epoxide hydrolase n=1 Tax=Cordyceps fumosorosea (strain ARSEF 2679) TaxID=1081104 RepID=A0A162JDP8_CORFA|nr:epoxide hydrolase [Cordyceps fumosorosea ARSEF 2679]OAA67432.1 epoxide hydrolase [Cordyceps fumosorosea ARSEF 2679]
MDTSKLKPNDPRVTSHYETIRGKKYHYIVGEPQGAKVGTMLLVHGFPDMGFGWRAQVPFFMSRGYQVIVPDNVGYARTDAPADLAEYTFKSTTADLAELARKYVGADGQIVLGGHDWGGLVAWRMVDRYPELIRRAFVVCTPYIRASAKYTALEDLIQAGILTNFKYQLQLGGPEVEARLQGREAIRKLLNAMYGGQGPNGELGFRVSSGVVFENLDGLGPSPLLSAEELDFYADEYARQQAPELRGPLNWYRTRPLNFEADKELAEQQQQSKVAVPSLFIAASRDAALPPAMSQSMEAQFEDLTRAEVDASHWALVEKADEVNGIVSEWLDKKTTTSKASL